MADKTNFIQALMHMVKGNLGTGILAMPASFAHTGLVNAIIGLPLLCLVATYCVHLIIKSSECLMRKSKNMSFDYAELSKHSFKSGPGWMRASSATMCRLVDATLLIAQMGVCCVYLVFVVKNILIILKTYNIIVNINLVFLAILPITLLLSFIRTLRRLAIASACANLLQALGVSLIIVYLIRDMGQVNMSERDNFRPFNEVALGFGTAMFAFEGISVVLPIYRGLRDPSQMSGCCGLINVSFLILLFLYMIIGLLGFLKYGHNIEDSITFNLPSEPLYDAVRAMFATSVFLTYPLQFYVPNEIVWNWVKRKFLISRSGQNMPAILDIQSIIPAVKVTEKEAQDNKFDTITTNSTISTTLTASTDVASSSGLGSPGEIFESRISETPKTTTNKTNQSVVGDGLDIRSANCHHLDDLDGTQEEFPMYEYLCRTILVLFTFALAMIVPKLNLLMDLIGSITGTALSLIIPSLIHIGAFWDSSEGFDKASMILIDSAIILVGLLAGISGSISSLTTIIRSFNE